MVEPTDEPLDLPAALGEVAKLAEEDAAGTGQSLLEVRVYTDLQRSSLSPTLEEAAAADEESLERMLNRARTRLAEVAAHASREARVTNGEDEPL